MKRILLALFATSVLSSSLLSFSDIFMAVRNGDEAQVRALVQNKEQANLRNPQGATLLMIAAQHASPAIVKYLLEQGADPKAANPLGATPLHWIGGEGKAYAAKVEALLSHGADPNATSNLGRTPLTITAATHGNAAALRLLLAKGADPKKVDATGDGPLGNAATSADTEMVSILIEAGANIEERGIRGPAIRGASPLMRATLSDCLECVKLLLRKGANPNVVSLEPRTIKAGQQDMGKLTALVLAAQFNRKEIAKLLVQAGASIDTPDARGMTPLMMASTLESQDPYLVEFLKSKGADVSVKSKDGESLTDWTAKWKPASLPPASIPTRAETVPTPALAVSRSLDLMLRSNEKFFEKSGCVGCHHQVASGILAGAALDRGVRFDSAMAAKQLSTARVVSQPLRETVLQRVPIGGAPFANAVLLQSWAAQKVAPDALTDALVHDVAGMQHADGYWIGMTQRPPVQYSLVTDTALAINVLRAYGSPGRREEFDSRIARAVRWLKTAPTPYTEDVVMQVLGLHWAGKPVHYEKVLRLQRDDGGFAQRPGFASDAYATGQALYALAQSGYDIRSQAFRNGVQFLLRTQAEDGSWYVRSRSVKFQPYFESGFPYGHDQWISASATAWAALALTQTLSAESSRASAPGHSAPGLWPLE